VEAEIDLGFSVSMTRKVRLYGINAPEVRGDEKEQGEESKVHLIKICYLYALNQKGGRVMDSPVLLIKTYKDRTGKYGRILGTLMGLDNDEPIDLNQKMVEDSFASQREK
jgi:micrococcal nuclease